MSEYFCFDCMDAFPLKDEDDRKCPKCEGDSVMKTYNASNSAPITSRDFY